MFGPARWPGAALLVAGCAALLLAGCAAVLLMAGSGELWDPATVAIPQREAWWWARHHAKVDEARRRRGAVDLLLVGDSITQNYDRHDKNDLLNFEPLWGELFVPHRAMNLGANGDRTSHVLWRLRHGEVDGLSPKDVVLLIGTNNLGEPRWFQRGQSVAQVTQGVMAVVEEIHKRMPLARVLVLSVLPSSFSAQRSARADAVNGLVRSRLGALGYARYLDVTPIFMDGSRLRTELFYDPQLMPGAASVHPSPAGQRLLAEAVLHALYGE